jgi:hypothetical protein
MHPKNVIHTQQTTLIFTLCIHVLSPLPFQTPTHTKKYKKKMYLQTSQVTRLLTHHTQPLHPKNPIPPVAHGCHVSREIMGASEHSSREKRQPRTRAWGEGSGPASWLAEKGVCGSVARDPGHGLHPALRNSGI